MKFFKRQEKQCSICGATPVMKTLRGHGKIISYCKPCYTKEYNHSHQFVINKVEQRKQEGKKIGLTQTKELVKEIIDDRNKQEQQNTTPAQTTNQSTS